MNQYSASKNTQMFFVQAAVSFSCALVAVIVGIAYLPVDGWVRGFLALGALYLVTSSFTLAKVVRDAEERQSINQRIDQARVDKILAEHDPFIQVA